MREQWSMEAEAREALLSVGLEAGVVEAGVEAMFSIVMDGGPVEVLHRVTGEGRGQAAVTAQEDVLAVVELFPNLRLRDHHSPGGGHLRLTMEVEDTTWTAAHVQLRQLHEAILELAPEGMVVEVQAHRVEG